MNDSLAEIDAAIWSLQVLLAIIPRDALRDPDCPATVRAAFDFLAARAELELEILAQARQRLEAGEPADLPAQMLVEHSQLARDFQTALEACRASYRRSKGGKTRAKNKRARKAEFEKWAGPIFAAAHHELLETTFAEVIGRDRLAPRARDLAEQFGISAAEREKLTPGAAQDWLDSRKNVHD